MAGGEHGACIVGLDTHPVALSHRERRRVFVSVAMGQVEHAKRMRFTIRTPIEFR